MNVCLAAIAGLCLALPAAAQDSSPVWIHGRVCLPPGCPEGPVEVVARRGDPFAALLGELLAGAPVDASGAFGFGLAAPDSGFYLVLEARWLDLRPLWIEPRAGEGAIEIVLVPALRGILHGRFVAASEGAAATRSVSGSWVWIEGAELRAAEVDAEGEFELCGPAAELQGVLCARPHEFAPLYLPAPAIHDGESSECILALSEPARIRGRIQDSGGHGIEGATLSVWRGRDEQRPLAITPWGDVLAVTSGADGEFDAEGLPSGDLVLRAEDPRWRALGVEVLGLRPGEERSGLELVLLRAACLRGVVLDEHGEPVAGARITAGARDRAGGLMVATTDARGRYAFDGALPGEYVLSASHEGCAAHSAGALTLREGEREQAGLLLRRGSALRIELADHAAPVHLRVIDALGFLRADQRVWQGELELVLPPGSYTVVLTERDGTRRARELVLTGRERRPFTLRM